MTETAGDDGRRRGAARERRRGRMSARRQGERGKNGWRASLPHSGAPAAACGGEEAAERRRDGWPKLDNGGRRRSSVR
jgi:hypothetical protein